MLRRVQRALAKLNLPFYHKTYIHLSRNCFVTEAFGNSYGTQIP